MKLEAIVPNNPIDSNIMVQQLTLAVNQALRDIDNDFQKTINSWTTQVVFLVKTAVITGDRMEGSVSTTSPVYKYVALGTRPHEIKPKKAKFLHFQSGYKPKTRVNTIGSGSGGPFGEDVFSRGVQHPGTEARNFHIEIAKRRQRNLENYVTAALLRAIKAAGKGF